MTDSNKSFFKTLFASIFGFAVLYIIFISFVNPQMTAPFSLTDRYKPYHDNFLLRKAELMEGQSYETIILGSSTSEAFSVSETDEIFNTSTFHGVLGGGNTASRYVLFKKAQKNFKDLKRVIYVADLYEFNRPKPVEILSFNDALSSELKDKGMLPGKVDYVKYLFSHKMLESALMVIKRERNNYESPLMKDGSTKMSMVMSTVHAEEDPEKKRAKLSEAIRENYVTYSKSILGDFKELNPDVKKLLLALVKEARERDIELIFILSPYHAEFRRLLFQNKQTEDRYREWIAFFSGLEKEYGVKVSNPLEGEAAMDPASGAWRDGIHFYSQTAAQLLREIAQGEQK